MGRLPASCRENEMFERYRILDLTDDRGHLAGMVLAQLGSEVVAIEPPDGQRARRQAPFAGDEPDPEQSLTHWSYNRGKKSVVVDLETSQGRNELEELMAGADAMIESGALPIDLAGIQERHPHLVVASISGYGLTGPKADWLATDIINTAGSGTMGITGDRDRAPVRQTVPQTWHFAASDALCAVLLGLRERDRSGLGQHADISAQQSYIVATQYQMLYPFAGAPSTKRLSGGAEFGPITLKLVYETLDGFISLVFLVGPTVGPYNTRLFQWMDEEGLCPEEFRDVDWIGFGAQLTSDPEAPGVLNRGAIAINEFTKTKTKAQMLEAALERNLLLAPITTTREILDLDHLSEREYWRTINGVRYPGPVARPAAMTLVIDEPPPRLGQHTDEIVGQPRSPSIPDDASPERAGDPMTGVKVLDLTWAIAGPYTSRMLGDFGADVIRIESESKPCIMRGAGPFMKNEPGAENSLSYLSINASKMSLAIDLRQAASIEVMEKLVAWADVLIESYSVGVIDRIGLGYEKLSQINPGLIMVSTSLMGQTGPIKEISGFGNVGAAVAGFFPLGGWPDRAPCGPFGAYSDYISPRFTFATVLAALEHRKRTGKGQLIDYSQMEGAVHLLAPALLNDDIHGIEGMRDGNRDANMAPHGAYAVAGDDRWIAVACETDRQWQTLAIAIGRDDLVHLTLAQRFDMHDELDRSIESWTSKQDGQQLETSLQLLGVPAHRVSYAPEVVADPQLLHRNAFVQASHDSWGEVWIEETNIPLSRTPGGARSAAPTFGEHLYPILTEILGHDADSAADLIASGIFT
ncbi:MAG: crotonobetainyl-CoA:carnitine CoA-transferase CaiB-like acyl-CoA transferase [Acidimicrobiales bacterium]|jgi:crotonobetainyl-CoA:carnitine CoA-transferase CaiB-like acyl-CoA transferase